MASEHMEPGRLDEIRGIVKQRQCIFSGSWGDDSIERQTNIMAELLAELDRVTAERDEMAGALMELATTSTEYDGNCPSMDHAKAVSDCVLIGQRLLDAKKEMTADV